MYKLNSASEISEFKKRYEKISGLEIPESFLIDSKIYAFQKDKEIVGGFILSNKRPLRTLQIFTKNKILRSKINSLDPSSILEVCCFWIEKKYRKKKLFPLLVWLRMAIQITRQKEKFIIYGTNSEGLAKIYGHPKGSELINNEIISLRNNYIFMARRSQILIGTLKIIISKIKGKTIKSNTLNNTNLEKSIYHELSI